jgi:GNAT superfamily N-acetyltransferase
MSYSVVPFREEHIQDAAALFVDAYRVQRGETPSLPPRHEETTTIAPMLQRLVAGAPGIAAIRDGKLVGYVLGMLLESFRGQRSMYSPEWAHALASGEQGVVFQEMYAQIARRWVANGSLKHLFTALANDSTTLTALHWLGFGLMGVDAIRDVTPIAVRNASVTLRRADASDVALAAQFSQALARYSAQAPIFLAYTKRRGEEHHRQWLSEHDHALWLAFKQQHAAACIGFEPSNPEAAYVISDTATISITRAFTIESERASGIGTALLGRGLEWARDAGFERCAVDFEPQNILGARFWLRHFQPVCFSLERHIDPSITWAHELREEGDIW